MKKLLVLPFVLFSFSASSEEIFQGQIYQAVEDHMTHDKAVDAVHLIEEKSQKLYRLQFKDGKIPSELKNLKAGSKVKLKGKKSSSSVVDYLSSEEVAALGSVTYPTNALKGTRSVLGVRVNFTDASPTCTDATIGTTLFDPASATSVKNYYQTVSRGMLDITGSVVTVNISASAAGATTCDYSTWTNLANQALAANGISTSGYGHKMFFLPTSVPCSWAGLGNVSGANTWVKSCSGQVMVHELGHNFGLAHASTGTSEYGDGSDAMGTVYRQFNSAHRHQAGWISNEKIQTISSSGTYRIGALNNDPSLESLPQVIRIYRPATAEYVYLSYRALEGNFDMSLAAAYANKLNIHRYKGTGYAKTLFIAGLDVGGVHNLPEGDLSINVLSRDAGSIEFALSGNDNCAQNAPSFTVPPEFVVKAGVNLSGSLSLKNNHSQACGNQIFDLTIAPHASITASLNPAMLDLPYGASGNSSISLGVLAAATSGIYTLPVKAISRANPLIFASGSVIVKVDNSAPSIPTNVYVSARKSAVIVSFSASTDNVGMGNYKILRNGIVIGQTSSTSYTDSGAPAGSQSYQVIAVDRAGNQSAASSAALITIAASGGGGGKGRK